MELNVNPIFLFKKILNSSSIGLFLYILYKDTVLFISKPTYTSNLIEKWEPRHFPDIVLCPFPAVDLDQLMKHGYRSFNEYFSGNIEDSQEDGWSGNSSASIERIIEDMSVLKSAADCPVLRDDETYKPLNLNFVLTMSVFPYGRCCRAAIQENNDKVQKMYFRVKLKDNLPQVEGFQMFFSSQESSHIHKLNKFNTFGNYLITSKNDSGYAMYVVKLHEDIQLEDDPKTNCKNYQDKRGYAKCLDKEYLHQSMSALNNCTPPYITSKSEFWCKETLDLSTTEAKYFLWQFRNSRKNDGQCLPPCNTTKYVFFQCCKLLKSTPLFPFFLRYQIEHLGVSKRQDRYGMIIEFENDVEITESKWTIPSLTFVMRIGANMGLCRSIVWLVNFFVDYILLHDMKVCKK